MLLNELTHSGSSILSALVFMPLIGVVGLMALNPGEDKKARLVASLSAALTLICSLIVLSRFDSSQAGMQMVEVREWIPEFGVNYILGIDGITIYLVVLTTLLTLLVCIASQSVQDRLRAYLACVLLLEVGMLGAFVALDGLVFYVFWELMLIPMYFLIGVWGGKRKLYAAMKFVLYTAFGSLLMLVAIVSLAYAHYVQFGNFSFALGDWTLLVFGMDKELLLFSAFALAFAIKVPVFPLHTWLPDAHVEAPTGGSVILAGILLKMGLYGLIRFALPVFPDATVAAAPLFAVLGVIGIVFGALVAWVQTDIKKLVAYSSVSHLGFCVLGYAVLNQQGMQGCILQMLNHGVSTAALFLVVGVLYDRKHTRLIADYGGLGGKVPVFAFVFLVFTLSSIGLPLTNGFVGEFLILLGGFKFNKVIGAIAVSGVILGAIYMLSLYRRVVFGKLDESKNGDLTDLNLTEKCVFAPLLVLVFVVGLAPQPFIRGIQPSSDYFLGFIDIETPTPGKSGVVNVRDLRAVSLNKSKSLNKSEVLVEEVSADLDDREPV